MPVLKVLLIYAALYFFIGGVLNFFNHHPDTGDALNTLLKWTAIGGIFLYVALRTWAENRQAKHQRGSTPGI